MFETLPHFEFRLPLPPEAFGGTSGTKSWRLIRRVFNTPCFMLSIRLEGADSCHTYFVADFNDAIRILSRKDVTWHEVFVLIPNYLSEHGDPALHRLTQVFRGTFDGDDVEGYACANGQIYFGTDNIRKGEILADKVIVYEI
jgi:hypothetical protein